jgi:hypothetical protein
VAHSDAVEFPAKGVAGAGIGLQMKRRVCHTREIWAEGTENAFFRYLVAL